ncbi:MAG: S8 family serine peptidase [Chloroflexi bacterium]|nr:S8 family serine peptidase [Chloroflexota bacterium]
MGTDSFTYRVSDGTNTPLTATATIVIAQESGFSVEGAAIPQSGLDAWTAMDEGTVGGPSSWSTATAPEVGQVSGIGSGTADVAQKGTFLLLNRGVSRADVTYTFNVRSTSSGALGLMFRYQDANNYYRFSMDNEQGATGGYRRLVKVQNGVATTLWSEPVPQGQPAYFPTAIYALTVSASGPTLTVALTDADGVPVFTRQTTDASAPLLTGRGYALYSETNTGSYFEFVGAEVTATPYQLEVRTGGTGGGTVQSSPTAIVTPGASVVTYDGPTSIQLTAQPGPGSTFQNWTNSQGQVLGTSATLPLTLSNSTIVTANFTGTPPPLQTLDIDGNTIVEPLKDGLLILRYMFGFTGTALTTGLIGQNATRTSPTDILTYLNQAKTTLLDVDGNINGTTITAPEPLKDGLLILRYLFDFTNDNLIAGVVGAGAQRATAQAIQNFLSLYDLDPLTNPLSTTSELSALSTQLVMPSDWSWNDLFGAAGPSPIGTNPADLLTDVTAFRTDPRFAEIDGDGMTAVIIDTGIDVDHPFFGADLDLNGIADRLVYQWDFADNDPDASDRNGHGSHIASLIGSEDPTYPGVAPDADLIVLKVFKDSGTGNFGFLEQALQWVIAHADDYGGIDVVNLSLGDGQNWTLPVNPYGLADEFAALANEDILTIAASGNSFFTAQSLPGVTYPAADPNVLAVGAVWTQDFGGPWRFSSGAIDVTTGPDQIASFTQRHAQLLDVLAPGARLIGANAGGGTQILQGTSQAAGYFSGIALLAQQAAQQELGRALTPQEFTTLVRETGTPVVDGDNENDNVVNTGLTFPRVDLLALAEQLFINDAPSFAAGPDQTVNEDAGPQTVADWATNLRAGAANESGQTLAFVLTNSHPDLFSVGPAIDPATGALTYTPAADASGTATIAVRLTDSGGTANGGVDTSVEQTFTITMKPVNDAPVGTDKTVTLDHRETYRFTTADFGFTDQHDRPSNRLKAVTIVTLPESGVLRLDGYAVAAGQVIAAEDLVNLAYRPKTNGARLVIDTLMFQVQDDGGTANGGVDLALMSNTITLRVVRDHPQFDDGTPGKGRGHEDAWMRDWDDERSRKYGRPESGPAVGATPLIHSSASWVSHFVKHGARATESELVVRL